MIDLVTAYHQIPTKSRETLPPACNTSKSELMFRNSQVENPFRRGILDELWELLLENENLPKTQSRTPWNLPSEVSKDLGYQEFRPFGTRFVGVTGTCAAPGPVDRISILLLGYFIYGPLNL